ncbi:MAG: Maf family protein [Ferruginibacter sp.]
MEKIILASQSPRRSQLLQWADVPFEVLVSDSDESYNESESFTQIAVHIARNKALAVMAKSGAGRPVLAADTIVVCNDTIIGKPKDREEAISFLKTLSGNIHTVVTGVVILHNGKEQAFADETKVEFHPLTEDQISYYVDKYQPYDKAGAYAIQEWIGVVGIKSIHGDFYNVMGLPVSRVLQSLKEAGLL